MATLSTLSAPAATIATGLVRFFDPRFITLSKMGKLLAIVLLLANLKVIPFFWHARFWHALYLHLLRRKKQLPTPKHLFAPVVITSRSPLYECDFNLHKSNSTYFSDLDISRTHLVALLIKKSLRARRLRGEESMYVALAGVTCLFRREIKPYENYEVWTRVLGWDEKWFWVVSHFVSPKATTSDGKRKVFASALSKYVFKVGRKTIAPELVLEEGGVLPARPGEVEKEDGVAMSMEDSGMGSFVDAANTVKENFQPQLQHLQTAEPSREASPAPPTQQMKSDEEDDLVDEKLLEGKIEIWDWETTEKMRRQGTAIARNMLGLDALEGMFEKGNELVGGRMQKFGTGLSKW